MRAQREQDGGLREHSLRRRCPARSLGRGCRGWQRACARADSATGCRALALLSAWQAQCRGGRCSNTGGRSIAFADVKEALDRVRMPTLRNGLLSQQAAPDGVGEGCVRAEEDRLGLVVYFSNPFPPRLLPVYPNDALRRRPLLRYAPRVLRQLLRRESLNRCGQHLAETSHTHASAEPADTLHLTNGLPQSAQAQHCLRQRRSRTPRHAARSRTRAARARQAAPPPPGSSARHVPPRHVGKPPTKTGRLTRRWGARRRSLRLQRAALVVCRRRALRRAALDLVRRVFCSAPGAI